METIEDIILDHDRRGMSLLRQHLPSDFCGRAADILANNSGTVFIVTGFYILAAEATETYGPPGAFGHARVERAIVAVLIFSTV